MKDYDLLKYSPCTCVSKPSSTAPDRKYFENNFEERTFGAIIKVNLNDNSPLKCVRHLSSPVKKVF